MQAKSVTCGHCGSEFLSRRKYDAHLTAGSKCLDLVKKAKQTSGGTTTFTTTTTIPAEPEVDVTSQMEALVARLKVEAAENKLEALNTTLEEIIKVASYVPKKDGQRKRGVTRNMKAIEVFEQCEGKKVLDDIFSAFNVFTMSGDILVSITKLVCILDLPSKTDVHPDFKEKKVSPSPEEIAAMKEKSTAQLENTKKLQNSLTEAFQKLVGPLVSPGYWKAENAQMRYELDRYISLLMYAGAKPVLCPCCHKKFEREKALGSHIISDWWLSRVTQNGYITRKVPFLGTGTEQPILNPEKAVVPLQCETCESLQGDWEGLLGQNSDVVDLLFHMRQNGVLPGENLISQQFHNFPKDLSLTQRELFKFAVPNLMRSLVLELPGDKKFWEFFDRLRRVLLSFDSNEPQESLPFFLYCVPVGAGVYSALVKCVSEEGIFPQDTSTVRLLQEVSGVTYFLFYSAPLAWLVSTEELKGFSSFLIQNMDIQVSIDLSNPSQDLTKCLYGIVLYHIKSECASLSLLLDPDIAKRNDSEDLVEAGKIGQELKFAQIIFSHAFAKFTSVEKMHLAALCQHFLNIPPAYYQRLWKNDLIPHTSMTQFCTLVCKAYKTDKVSYPKGEADLDELQRKIDPFKSFIQRLNAFFKSYPPCCSDVLSVGETVGFQNLTKRYYKHSGSLRHYNPDKKQWMVEIPHLKEKKYLKCETLKLQNNSK